MFCLAWLSSGFPARRALAQAQPSLELGLLPNVGARTLVAQYRPMREYLEHSLGRSVQLSTAPHWSAFHQRVLAYEYDLMVTAIHLARLAQLDRDYQPLVQMMPDIECLLVCAAARPLGSVADLRGRTLVLSNPQSLVAVRGLHWLAEQGLQQERDFRLSRRRTDDSAATALVRGDAVAALVSSGEFLATPEPLRMQLQVVSRFARVPGFVVMASPRLQTQTAQAARTALLAFDGRSALGQSFFRQTGLQGMRVLPDGQMEAMDPLVASTRRLLQEAP